MSLSSSVLPSLSSVFIFVVVRSSVFIFVFIFFFVRSSVLSVPCQHVISLSSSTISPKIVQAFMSASPINSSYHKTLAQLIFLLRDNLSALSSDKLTKPDAYGQLLTDTRHDFFILSLALASSWTDRSRD